MNYCLEQNSFLVRRTLKDKIIAVDCKKWSFIIHMKIKTNACKQLHVVIAQFVIFYLEQAET